MNQPFFSVIMPVYNRSSFLSTTIPSVLKQTFSDFELICIDDGSDDDSVKMIESLQKKDNRIKLIPLTKNQGRCIARNIGINGASAEWICFLDSDDKYLDNHLSTLHNLITTNPNYLGFATEQIIQGKSKKYNTHKFSQNGCQVVYADLIRSNYIHLNQFCFNKKKLKINFPNENIPISEDWFFMRYFTLKYPILKSNIATTEYNEHATRTVATANPAEFAYWNFYTAELLIKETDLSHAQKSKLRSFSSLLCANILLSGGLKKDSLKYLKKSLTFIRTYFDILFYKALIKYLIPIKSTRSL